MTNLVHRPVIHLSRSQRHPRIECNPPLKVLPLRQPRLSKRPVNSAELRWHGSKGPIQLLGCRPAAGITHPTRKATKRSAPKKAAASKKRWTGGYAVKKSSSYSFSSSKKAAPSSKRASNKNARSSSRRRTCHSNGNASSRTNFARASRWSVATY